MREFSSFGAFAAHLLTLQASEALALHKGLKRVAVEVEKTAKAEIGHYQQGIGPFQAWPELAESTKQDRLNKGFTENDPLLRTGGLRDSIDHAVGGLEAVIGSNEDVMIYQELGTKTIPPRPVLGPAALRNEDHIKAILGQAAVAGLVGGSLIDKKLGYDFDT
ncbi:MAG: hypothetical protein ACXWAT_00910 [Methylobacter sp.]